MKLRIPEDLIVCFDTETNGLDDRAEAVQVAVVDYNCIPIFSELIKPTVPVPPEVVAIHGISNEKLESCRSMGYYWDYLVGNLMREKVILGYNVAFDIRILMQSISQHTRNSPMWSISGRAKTLTPLMIIDVMSLFHVVLRTAKFFKLGDACKELNINPPDSLEAGFHDALYDCTMTMLLYKELVRRLE